MKQLFSCRFIVDWPHSFVRMFMRLEVNIDAMFVKQVFNSEFMQQRNSNANLSDREVQIANEKTYNVAGLIASILTSE